MNEKILNTKEAARYLSLRPNTLEIWRVQGVGPTFLKLNRSVRYRRQDLEKFIENGASRSTSEYGRLRAC